MNDETLKLMSSECEKDYKKRHFWDKIGVTHDSQGHYLIWQCSQCRNCVAQKLDFLQSSDVGISCFTCSHWNKQGLSGCDLFEADTGELLHYPENAMEMCSDYHSSASTVIEDERKAANP